MELCDPAHKNVAYGLRQPPQSETFMHSATLLRIVCVLFAALLCTNETLAKAGSGKLDYMYRHYGRALVGHPRSQPALYDPLADVSAVDNQGRVLIGGSAVGPGSYGRVATLIRLDASGAHDTSFGSAGYVEFLPPIDGGTSTINGLAVDEAGGILVLFDYYGEAVGQLRRSRLCRLFESGAPDLAFGTAGPGCRKVEFHPDSVAEYSEDLAIAPDGRIVVMGTSDVTSPHSTAFARFHANGAPDKCFGSAACDSNGVVLHTLSEWEAKTYRRLAIAPDGRMVLALRAKKIDEAWGDWWALRFTVYGNQDPTFEPARTGRMFDGGFVPNQRNLTDVLVRPDGKVVLAGMHDGRIELSQFTVEGKLDMNFGTGGNVSTWFTDVNPARYAYLALQNDGKLLVAGFNDGGANGSYAAVLRLLKNGAPDPQFGSEGRRVLGFTDDLAVDGFPDFKNADTVRGIHVHGGHILVAGMTDAGTEFTTKYAALRLDRDGVFRDGLEIDPYP